jgi:hypothetical protein
MIATLCLDHEGSVSELAPAVEAAVRQCLGVAASLEQRFGDNMGGEYFRLDMQSLEILLASASQLAHLDCLWGILVSDPSRDANDPLPQRLCEEISKLGIGCVMC